MCLSQKQKKNFPNNFLLFGKPNLILNILKTKMTLIADAYLNLWPPKHVVR